MLVIAEPLPTQTEMPIVGRIVHVMGTDGSPSSPVLFQDSEAIKAIEEVSESAATTEDSRRSDSPNPRCISGFTSELLNGHEDGDVVLITRDDRVRLLFRTKSSDNALFVTGRCNSNCLMCSQPPVDRDDIPFWYEINRKVIDLLPKDTRCLGITGGEPTLAGASLYTLLQQMKATIPDTSVDILTNGRAFAWVKNVRKVAAINHHRFLFSIPLHSDYPVHHDYVAQSRDAFTQTVAGILNLATYRQRVEIRIILHSLSVLRLSSLARFIFMNMPFVENVAFMGLEYTGYTPHNESLVWIDPAHFTRQLSDAAAFLSSSGLRVSIYNLPLCILPTSLWQFSVSAISDWKRVYLDGCRRCRVMSRCGGIFRSCVEKLRNHIHFIE